ncbi:hypothetical protein WJX81_008164 [Elliptochloris bilobata]|uniref:CBS domain-containing protein n=1 Tax=Elliptochloris bilobata TaxID=381761 RepID=A0AAW1SJ17_9CHLO
MLEHNDNVGKAMQEFNRARVLSAPIVISPDLEDLEEETVPEERDSTPSLLGWLDVSDLVEALIKHLESRLPEGQKLPTKMLALMKLLEAEGPGFAKKELITLTGGQDKDLIYQAHTGTTVLDTLREHYLKVGEDGMTKVVHRVAIFDSHGSITSVISQLDVMRFLLERADKLGGVLDATLEDLGMLAGKAPVQTVCAHEPCLLALQKILAAGVAGAAVVEAGTAGGATIANLSASDLRTVQPDHLSTLALPVAEFLALQHHTAYVGYSVHSAKAATHPFFSSRSSGSSSGSLAGASPRAGGSAEDNEAGQEAAGGGGAAGGTAEDVRLVTCTPGATLREVLVLLIINEVHRVYVVAPGGPPHAQAIITTTDVMRLLAGVW